MRDRRLLFFGDSFVAGMGDPEGRGWVGRVVASAAAVGLPVTPYNLGVRGETSTEVAERWWGEAQARVVAGADCRLVVSFGANDCTAADDGRPGPRVDPAVSLMAMESVLVTAAESGLGVFVVGPAPVGDERDDVRVLELDAAYGALCEESGVPYVSVARALLASATWTEEARQGDGAHPGDGGYAVLTRLVLDGGFLAWVKG